MRNHDFSRTFFKKELKFQNIWSKSTFYYLRAPLLTERLHCTSLSSSQLGSVAPGVYSGMGEWVADEVHTSIQGLCHQEQESFYTPQQIIITFQVILIPDLNT